MNSDNSPVPNNNANALKLIQALARVVARRRMARDYGEKPGEIPFASVMYEMPEKPSPAKKRSTKRQIVR